MALNISPFTGSAVFAIKTAVPGDTPVILQLFPLPEMVATEGSSISQTIGYSGAPCGRKYTVVYRFSPTSTEYPPSRLASARPSSPMPCSTVTVTSALYPEKPSVRVAVPAPIAETHTPPFSMLREATLSSLVRMISGTTGVSPLQT